MWVIPGLFPGNLGWMARHGETGLTDARERDGLGWERAHLQRGRARTGLIVGIHFPGRKLEKPDRQNHM